MDLRLEILVIGTACWQRRQNYMSIKAEHYMSIGWRGTVDVVALCGKSTCASIDPPSCCGKGMHNMARLCGTTRDMADLVWRSRVSDGPGWGVLPADVLALTDAGDAL